MSYRLVDASGDVVIEAEAASAGEALVDLGRALAHVLTDGSDVEPRERRTFDLATPQDDPARLAVAFLDELVFLFDAHDFLVAGGGLDVEARGEGRRIHGTLEGERFDPKRHRSGTAVKAATLHDAFFEAGPPRARARLMLDL